MKRYILFTKEYGVQVKLSINHHSRSTRGDLRGEYRGSIESFFYIQRKCKHEKVSEIADALAEMSNICMQVELAK